MLFGFEPQHDIIDAMSTALGLEIAATILILGSVGLGLFALWLKCKCGEQLRQ